MNLIEHFINGKMVKGSSKKTSKVFNPATGEQTSEINLASKADVDLAVQKAKQAFTDWGRKPPAQRARIICKFKELIEKNSEGFCGTTDIYFDEDKMVSKMRRSSVSTGGERKFPRYKAQMCIWHSGSRRPRE